MKTNDELLSIGKAHMMNTYAQLPIVLTGGSGSRVQDINGNTYLDFVAGIAVNALGYGNDTLKAALKAVIDSGLTHCSNLYWNEHAVTAAALLADLSGLDRVFFCNSGAEANEAALKLARKYGFLHKGPDATKIISMKQSFHGRTYAAITATGQPKYHKGFLPLMPDIEFAEFNNSASVAALIDDKTCAVILEPIQGEGGIHQADPQFLKDVRELCDTFDALLIFDEVQCGMGRCGKPFAFQITGVIPDAVTLAKGLGAGIPIGALLASEKAASAFTPGDHASTFGGNLLSTAAASVVLTSLKEGTLQANAAERGEQLTAGLGELQQVFPELIIDIRGIGLMQGIELSEPAAPIIALCLKKGLLLVSAGTHIIRFVPPLTVTADEISEMLSILKSAISELNA
ncbi:MAG: aspartate aminotransferase family protein [Spirochaetia bacterium]|nr:aspartate aminotransferase family protein [Spirochaetia bacterium]